VTRRRRVDLDDRIRAAELDAYRFYGLAPREQFLTIETPLAPATVRLMNFGSPATDGPPLLLLHGIGSVNVLAAPLVAALADRHVIAVDWPGHGLSGASQLPPGAAVRPYATAVIRALLSELRLDEVDLVGHSMGAQFGLYAALDLGERVRRIVVLGAPGAAFAGIRPSALMVALAVPGVGRNLLRVPVSEKAFRRTNEKSLGAGALREVPPGCITAAHLVGRRPTFAPSLASYFRAMIKRGTVRPNAHVTTGELRTLRQPTLLVWGDEDTFLRPEDALDRVIAIPSHRLIRIAGAGHAPWLGHPDRVGAEISEYLRSGTSHLVR
jgi:pimeloyl-ACP methyl ester carboxylesterase